MSGGITNKCFPPANKCVNCKRKSHDDRPARVGDTSREYKRCTGCRLMTYCDQDCQREHWLRIHKHHCRFLEGRKQVKNSEHNPSTCALCFESRYSTAQEISKINSPKTTCAMEEVIEGMKDGIARIFRFHTEGKTCGCSATTAWPGHLPFSFGELSGQYIPGGADEISSHAVKLGMALVEKAENKNVKEESEHISSGFFTSRLSIWYGLLISGVGTLKLKDEDLSLSMNNLKRYLGPKNPWWIALDFSLDVLRYIQIRSYLPVEIKSDFLEKCKHDSRFNTLKQMFENDISHHKNIVFASTNNLFSQFKVWPQLMQGSLILLLPNGLRCQTCNHKVEGQFSLSVCKNQQCSHHPVWLPNIGENGSCDVYCSLLKNPNCVREGARKNVRGTIESNPERWEAFTDEWSLFLKLSRICDECGKRSLFSHRCLGCRAAQYCSTECQKKDGEFHKSVCAKWAMDESRTLGSAKEQMKYWKSEADKARKKYN